MKNSIASYVGWLLLVAALGFYIYGMGKAIYLSWPFKVLPTITTITPTPNPDPIPFWPELATLLSSIQALLLTNLGMVLGISITNRNSTLAKALLLNTAITKGIQTPPPDPMQLKEKIQVFAVIVYILVLIACLITWIHNDFTSFPSEIVSVVAESGKMFLGVILAYLAALI